MSQYDDTIQRIIEKEIFCNASTMVGTLTKAETVDMDDLLPCLVAPDFSAPPEDYRICQDDDGWFFQSFDYGEPAGWHGDDGDRFETERTAVAAAYDDANDNPEFVEALQHWLVSDWLADELEAVGALVARDVMGFEVWGRTECGQGLTKDSDLQAVARNVTRRLHEALHGPALDQDAAYYDTAE